jgi:hypothetical protein
MFQTVSVNPIQNLIELGRTNVSKKTALTSTIPTTPNACTFDVASARSGSKISGKAAQNH